MPFSKRPLIFASYIATILEQHNYAILICKIGLKHDYNEFSFINNLIYNQCLNNETKEAETTINEYLKKNILNSISNEERITLQATIGLFYLRTGKIDEGKDLYKSAIENSLIIKNNYYYNLALINFTRELNKINDPEFINFYDKFKNIKSEDIDIVYQKANTEKKLILK